MKSPEMEITIDRNGRVTVHIQGVKGRACLALADAIQAIVGLEESRKLTSEFYDQDGDVRIHGDTRSDTATQVHARSRFPWERS